MKRPMLHQASHQSLHRLLNLTSDRVHIVQARVQPCQTGEAGVTCLLVPDNTALQ